jgi:hypothetical protein
MEMGLCAYKQEAWDLVAKAIQVGQYLHSLHRGSAWTAVALVAIGVLHGPIQLLPDGAGQVAQSGISHGSGSV